jgi:hypothetical protein
LGVRRELEYLPIPALLISLISIVLAYVSFKRTKIFQEYEYAPRLQLNEELPEFSSQSLVHRPAIRYTAEIENRGSKPVEIESIYLDYGHRDDSSKRMRYSVAGEMYLSPGQKYDLEVERSWEDIAEVKERYYNRSGVRLYIPTSTVFAEGKTTPRLLEVGRKPIDMARAS